MGPAFVILFWLFALAFVGFIWGILVLLAMYGWKKGWGWLKWGAGVPAVLMVVCGILLVGVIGYGIVDSMNPKSVYKSAFGQAPAPAVKGLKSSVYWFADTGSIFLTFETSEEDVRRLVPAGLIEKSMAEMQEVIPEKEDNCPSWWAYKLAPDWVYFLRDARLGKFKPSRKGFYNETEYIAYDRNHGRAYYRFVGID